MVNEEQKQLIMKCGRRVGVEGMQHFYVIDSLWFPISLYTSIYGSEHYNTRLSTIGIVKTYDSITGELKYYIGVGFGNDLKTDEDTIVAAGANFHMPTSFDTISLLKKFAQTPRVKG